MVEYEDPIVGKIYAKVAYQFMMEICRRDAGRRETLLKQGKLIKFLADLSSELKNSKESRPKKVICFINRLRLKHCEIDLPTQKLVLKNLCQFLCLLIRQ